MDIVKRTGYVSPEQKRDLLAIMENNALLVSGKFSATFTKKEAQRQWQEISNKLNDIPGARKTWIQWRKVSTFARISD